MSKKFFARALFARALIVASLSIAAVGFGGRASAQTMVPTTPTTDSIINSPSGVEQSGSGQHSTCQSSNCSSDQSGNDIDVNPSTISGADSTSKAVGAIANLANQQGQSLSSAQKQELSTYFSSNPSAAAQAAANPQQFLTNYVKGGSVGNLTLTNTNNSPSKVIGSGNSGASTSGSISNVINNPIPNALDFLLGSLRPVENFPVNPGQISTGTSDNSCPEPVYGSDGHSHNYYFYDAAHTRTVLAPGQEVTLKEHNNCLLLNEATRVNGSNLQTRIALWNRLPCSEALPDILAELFGEGKEAEYLHAQQLPITAACNYGISALFPRTGSSSASLSVSVISVADLRKEISDLIRLVSASVRYNAKGSTALALSSANQAAELKAKMVQQGVRKDQLTRLVQLVNTLVKAQDTPVLNLFVKQANHALDVQVGLIESQSFSH